MYKHKGWRWLWKLVLLLLGIFLWVYPVAAHSEDGVLQVSNAPVGDYYLSVWTYPGMLRAGGIHFMVAVVDAVSQEVRTDTAVSMYIYSAEQNNLVATAQGTVGLHAHHPAFYGTDVIIKTPGVYRITLQVGHETGQPEELTFEIEVVSATLLKALIAILSIPTAVIIVWMFKESLRTWGIDRVAQENDAIWQKTRSRHQYGNK